MKRKRKKEADVTSKLLEAAKEIDAEVGFDEYLAMRSRVEASMRERGYRDAKLTEYGFDSETTMLSKWIDVRAEDAGRKDSPEEEIRRKLTLVRALPFLNWRKAKTVYSFARETAEAVADTAGNGEIPMTVLDRSPQDCFFVETDAVDAAALTGGLFAGARPLGFFFWKDRSFSARANAYNVCFSFVSEREDGELSCAPVHLPTADASGETVRECVERQAEAKASAVGADAAASGRYARACAEIAGKALALVTYLCAENAEIRFDEETERRHRDPDPGTARYRRRETRLALVGEKTAVRIREFRASGGATGGGSGKTGRRNAPHAARAHWQRYHVGPKAEPRVETRWIAPYFTGTGEVPAASLVRATKAPRRLSSLTEAERAAEDAEDRELAEDAWNGNGTRESGPSDDGGPRPRGEAGTRNGVKVWKRSRAVADAAMERAGWRCEICGKESPFRRRDGRPYAEPHHVVPMATQEDFGWSLDVPENVACLCADCHREAHLGERGAAISKRLFKTRRVALARRGIVLTEEEFDDILR